MGIGFITHCTWRWVSKILGSKEEVLRAVLQASEPSESVVIHYCVLHSFVLGFTWYYRNFSSVGLNHSVNVTCYPSRLSMTEKHRGRGDQSNNTFVQLH